VCAIRRKLRSVNIGLYDITISHTMERYTQHVHLLVLHACGRGRGVTGDERHI